jgi:hypothetical protein
MTLINNANEAGKGRYSTMMILKDAAERYLTSGYRWTYRYDWTQFDLSPSGSMTDILMDGRKKSYFLYWQK